MIGPFVLWFGLIALVVLIWLVFRKGGYKRQPLDAPPGPDWQKTEERFVDPSTGETLEVWFHPASGTGVCAGAAWGGPSLRFQQGSVRSPPRSRKLADRSDCGSVD